MSHRRLLPLLLLVAVVIGGGYWLSRDEGPAEPAAVDGRAEEPAADDPTLIGHAAPSGGEVPDPAPAKPDSSRRPWEWVGFLVGDDADARATGRVVFEDGTPAGGALIWKSYVYVPFFRTDAERGVHDFHLAATKSDADGRYRFTSRQIHTKLDSAALLAMHGDLAALILEPEDDGKLAQVPDLVLGPAVHPRVDVVNAYGDPIPSTLARLRVHFGRKGIPLMLLGDLGSTEGRLSFLRLPDREDLILELEVKHREYPDLKQDLDVDALRRGEVLRVEMQTGRVVRGRLLDAQGEPPRRVFLRAAAYDDYWRRQNMLEGVRAEPRPTGAFELHGVPAVESRLLVYQRPVGKKRVHISDLRPRVIDIPPGRNGETVDLGDVRLEPPGAIEGTVSGPAGEPIADARVEAGLAVHGIPGGWSATSDAAGRFVIADLLPAGYRVRVLHEFPGFGRREAVVEGVRPGSPPVALVLSGGSTLVVRLHPQGRPHEALSVKKHSLRKLRRADFGDAWVEGGYWSGGGSTGRSVFRFKYEPGTYRAVFAARGYQEVEIGPFEITEDADTAIDIELEPE